MFLKNMFKKKQKNNDTQLATFIFKFGYSVSKYAPYGTMLTYLKFTLHQ